MPPRNTPSIYPYLAASFIEASENGSTIEAIRFITEEKLKELKDAHKKTQELKKIVLESEQREAHIFSLLRNLEKEGGIIIYTLSTDIKSLMQPLVQDFLYLYERRMGKDEAERLKKLFTSNVDEAYDFIFEYEMDEDTKKFYIKRLSLVKHLDPDEESEETEDDITETRLA